MRLLGLLTLAVLPFGSPAVAQQASPYLPLHHWSTPYLEHFIARGVMADPTPLTRPWREADVLTALGGMDTTRLSAGERRVVRRLTTELTHTEEGPAVRVDGDVGAAAATHARRDPLRAAGTGHATASGGLDLTFYWGSVVAGTHPYFDTRLKYDPDFFGKKDRIIAGRNAEAYVAGQWRYGEVFFGSLDRNWGPGPVDGLLISANPYSYAHFAVTLGTPRFHIEGLLTQLDDLPDSVGTPIHRYIVAHRLLIRPPGATTVALWEGSILAGVNRTLEPWYANILDLGLLAQYDEGTPSNSLLGFDLDTRVHRAHLFAQVLLDDIQVDKGGAGNTEPPSYGITLGAQGGLGPAAWTGFYTQVANLTYRTPNPAETVMRRGVGLGRNFSDYDQLTVRASVVTGPGVLLSPEVTVLRQGEGDFRQPYPPTAAYDTTPRIFVGVVERTLRLATALDWRAGPWQLHADGGAHVIGNYQHVSGATKTKFVGSVGLTFYFRRESVLP